MPRAHNRRLNYSNQTHQLVAWKTETLKIRPRLHYLKCTRPQSTDVWPGKKQHMDNIPSCCLTYTATPLSWEIEMRCFAFHGIAARGESSLRLDPTLRSLYLRSTETNCILDVRLPVKKRKQIIKWWHECHLTLSRKNCERYDSGTRMNIICMKPIFVPKTNMRCKYLYIEV